MFVPENPYPKTIKEQVQELFDKIPAVLFFITGGEGQADTIRGRYSSWFEISQAVRNYSISGIQGGGYDKIDFEIVFADTEAYKGTLEVKHYTEPDNDTDVAKHIHDHLVYYGGLLTEEFFVNHHSTFEKYQQELRFIGPEKVAENVEFLDDYDILVDSYLSHEFARPWIAICVHCDREYTPFTGDGGQCGRCQWDHDRLERKAAERAEVKRIQEADPLYPTLQEGRNAVARKIAKLLRERSGKAWSVKASRGISSSSLTISAPPRRQNDYGYISAEDARELADLLGTDRPVHSQGESVYYEDRWHYLLAARGDFPPQWENNYSILAPHATHIVNSLLEGPKTAQALLQAYDIHAHPGLTERQLDHNLYILEKRGAVVALEDGKWRVADA